MTMTIADRMTKEQREDFEYRLAEAQRQAQERKGNKR